MFLHIALPTPLRRLFEYLPPQDVDPKLLIPGVRVKVPFQSRILIGILIGTSDLSAIPSHKLKSAIAILDDCSIFNQDIYQLCHWAANYYHYALGEVLSSALPTALRKGKSLPVKRKKLDVAVAPDCLPVLNPFQQHAVNELCEKQNGFTVFLLNGVTGSGKTEVYLRSIASVISTNKQALVLVPEISLTPQTIQRFQSRFSVPIVALHSGLTEKEKLHVWMAAREGEAKVVIGTRSAIFTPFAQLGLIIVDEEHDVSFKQQDRLRYHARDLAVMRASDHHIPIILGSATPSLESLLNVKRGRYKELSLPERAGNALLPSYQLVDVSKASLKEGLSTTLLESMKVHLSQGNQVLLFLNRRGFAPVLYCTECHWIAECSRCDARMVFHRSPDRLQCHHCDSRGALPSQCVRCSSMSLQPVGVGTQKLEAMLSQHFPTMPIVRVDRDSTRLKGSLQTLLDKIHQGEPAILLGTQMLAKGHHFPHVTLVGIVDADSGLFSADFRATEQMGQLLLQVSGRAGRAEKAGTVLIQTRHPEHPLLQALIHQGYQPFSTSLLAERAESSLPPFAYFAVLRAEAYQAQHVENFLQTIKNHSVAEAITVLGPIPALLAKRKGLHCQQLLIKAGRRGLLQQFLERMLKEIEQLSNTKLVKWTVDVDPVDI